MTKKKKGLGEEQQEYIKKYHEWLDELDEEENKK
jgi:hypothetical protein